MLIGADKAGITADYTDGSGTPPRQEWRFYRHGLDGSQNREAGRANAAYNIHGSRFTI